METKREQRKGTATKIKKQTQRIQKAIENLFTIKIVQTTQLSATAVNPPFTTEVKVTNNSGQDQWARADLGVTIGPAVIVSPTDNSYTCNNVPNGSTVYWSVPWTGRWSSQHDITARLWISGDTPQPGYQPDVQIASDSAHVPVGLRLVLPPHGKPPSAVTK